MQIGCSASSVDEAATSLSPCGAGAPPACPPPVRTRMLSLPPDAVDRRNEAVSAAGEGFDEARVDADRPATREFCSPRYSAVIEIDEGVGGPIFSRSSSRVTT